MAAPMKSQNGSENQEELTMALADQARSNVYSVQFDEMESQVCIIAHTLVKLLLCGSCEMIFFSHRGRLKLKGKISLLFV